MHAHEPTLCYDHPRCTILVPTCETQYDTIAHIIYRKNSPGSKNVGINANGMIWADGALHCITKEIGEAEPLWRADDRRLSGITDNEALQYPVEAIVQCILPLSMLFDAPKMRSTSGCRLAF